MELLVSLLLLPCLFFIIIIFIFLKNGLHVTAASNSNFYFFLDLRKCCLFLFLCLSFESIEGKKTQTVFHVASVPMTEEKDKPVGYQENRVVPLPMLETNSNIPVVAASVVQEVVLKYLFAQQTFGVCR